jgi:hypothetical protein
MGKLKLHVVDYDADFKQKLMEMNATTRNKKLTYKDIKQSNITLW